MDWLHSIDAQGFRLIHQQLRNPACDWALPFFSWNRWFVPALLLFVAWLLWKGGARGRIFVLMLVVVIAVGDGVVCNSIKHGIARPRPFISLSEVEPLVGRGSSGSMPSSHTANWFATLTLGYFYYRSSAWLLLPLALIVGFSRVYLGVHYPSDVLVGAVLGIGYSWGIVAGLDRLWSLAGPRWFPTWHQRLPSIVRFERRRERSLDAGPASAAEGKKARPEEYLRLGCVLLAVLLLSKLVYLASDRIELSEDEAYQWVWSKHLALSYYSKPPMIAYAQFIGTSLWGDTEFGVRFLSPVIGAILGLSLLRFFAREVSAEAGLWLCLAILATPLLAVGATLLTIDPLSVLFWTAAMLSGWRAVREDSTNQWLWTGLWTGLGFLSKYTALIQLLCWAVFFCLWKPARVHLRRPGPYLALGVLTLCTVPVLIWNWQHDWITVTHLANRGGLTKPWRPTARFLQEFVLSEFGLLNPVFFVAMIWAALRFWKEHPRDRLMVFFFSMGAPLFLFYFAYTVRAHVLPNWIAPAVLPMFCLMIVFWHRRWRGGEFHVGRWFTGGVTAGIVAVVLLHDTNLIGKITGRPVPPAWDPLNRVRGWQETARIVNEAREQLQKEGPPTFVIGDHYGITGLLSFYIPEAKSRVANDPMVFYQSSDFPKNQFYFWPGYSRHKGGNASFVQ